MKKFSFLKWAIPALCLYACQADLTEPVSLTEVQETVLTAVIESSSQTRTSLSPAEAGVSRVLWSEGDRIGVFLDGAENPVPFSLESGAGTREGSFSGPGRGNRYVALYPYGAGASLDGDKLHFELPGEQDYAEGSFASGAYPMVAVGGTPELSFKGIASILKISMKGHHSVTRLVFRPNDPGTRISGPATVSLADPSAPALSMDAGSKDSLVLNTGGVSLNSDQATDFFLVLPAQSYKGGFRVRIYTSTGYADKSYDADFTLRRAQVHPAAVFTLRLDYGVEPSDYLEGKGISSDPFRVGSLGDLLLMQGAVNAENGTIRSAQGLAVSAAEASYLLTADLDLAPLCSQAKGKSWTPVGNVASNDAWVFKGVFDGGGHTVKGLYVNSPLSDQGLFGKVSGTIRNLSVTGDVSGSSYCGLLAGLIESGRIENCSSKGIVTGSVCSGGLAGEAYHSTLDHCVNEAEIHGSDRTGGILGYSYFSFTQDCTNKGNVTGQYQTGGIAGYINGRRIFNCVNTGEVVGSSDNTGGICGYYWQGGKALNCINTGDVKGRDYVGGIGGCMSCDATLYQGPATIANCISLGKVVSTNGSSHIGTLAGYLGLRPGETLGPSESETAAWVKNSYYLAEVNPGMAVVSGGTGIAESNFALTEAQMKGTPYDGVLYVTSDGSGYNLLIDALNAGAVYWSANEPMLGGEMSDHFPLRGWEYAAPGSYPSLTDLEAQMPGQGKPVFEISGTVFEFNVKGGSLQVEVTSSLDYSLNSLPHWVSVEGVQTQPGRPHSHLHSFTVTANTTGQPREDIILFTNTAGNSLKVKVRQKAPYLTLSETELILNASGGSARVSVSSSLDWSVTVESDWFRVTPASGSGDDAISILVDENPHLSARGGSFVVSSDDGAFQQRISLVQSGKTDSGSDNWENLPFVHQSVAYRFTATWCTWCPYMNQSVRRAQELYPGKIQHLALHSGGSDLEFGPAATLMDQFRTNAFPTGIMDGRIRIENSTDIDAVAARFIAAAKQTEETYGTVSGLSLRSVSVGQRVSIDVDAYFKQAGDYKITVLLVEDGIIHPQTNGGNDYVHDNIVRHTATDITGDVFTVSTALSKRSFHYTLTVPEGEKIEKMRVFAYIQKPFGSLPRIQSDDYGDYYIDNCATAPVGETLKLALVGGGGGSGGSGGENEEIIPGGEIQ